MSQAKNHGNAIRAASKALLDASRQGDVAALASALAMKAEIDAKDRYGWTSAMHAAANGHDNCLRTLIQAGLDTKARDNLGMTALLAAQYGHEDCFWILIQTGADIDTQNDGGQSAAMMAAFNGQERLLRKLIQAGADIDAQNNGGQSAVMLAAFGGHEDCLRVLLHARADVDAKQNGGWTAAQIAARYGHHELAALLEAFSLSRRETLAMSDACDSATATLASSRPKIRV